MSWESIGHLLIGCFAHGLGGGAEAAGLPVCDQLAAALEICQGITLPAAWESAAIMAVMMPLPILKGRRSP